MNLEERVTAIEEALGWHKQAKQPVQTGSKTGKTETTIHPETWPDMPQPASGITAQDLDDLLNIVSPDVFMERIRTLKAKLAQPAPGITEQECLDLVDQTLHPHYVTMGKPLAEKLYRLLKAKLGQSALRGPGLTRERIVEAVQHHLPVKDYLGRPLVWLGTADAIADDLLALRGPTISRERIVAAWTTVRALDIVRSKMGAAIADELLGKKEEK